MSDKRLPTVADMEGIAPDLTGKLTTQQFIDRVRGRISEQEWRLIEALRAHHGWGEATVILKDGRPVMVRGLREDVKLTDDK
jgi:hypothetical protein